MKYFNEVYPFLIKYPSYKKRLIELNFDFSINQLLKLQEDLYWSLLSENKNIKWDDDILLQFKNKWDYEILCQNPSVFFTENTLKKLEGKLNFNWLAAYCRNTKWTLGLIEKFRNRLSWEAISCANISDINEDYIWQNRNELDWTFFSSNYDIPWSEDLIRRFEDYWDWQSLYYNSGISFNKELPILLPEEERWTFVYGENLNPEEYIGKWSWTKINNLLIFNWTDELIEKYKQHINFHTLSQSKYVSWSIELIEKYQDSWVWSYPNQFGGSLSHNPYLPWSYELVMHFEAKWEWGSERIANKNSNILDYHWGLADLWELPWSIEFIKEFEHRLDFKGESIVCQNQLIRNQGIWDKVFKAKISIEDIFLK